ncbi:MAG TPA: N-acetyltransferase [Chloroflexi bacterium]|nr:N-acetyltransferase [Chloroflexota bacterium]
MSRDRKASGDSTVPGVSQELGNRAKERIEQASQALEQQGIRPRTLGAEKIAVLADQPASDSSPPGWNEQLPPAHGEAHDAVVTDRLERSLVLRTEDGSLEQLRRAIQTDRGHIVHPVRIRAFDGRRQVGHANLTLEIDKTFSDTAGHYDRLADCRVRLNDIYVEESERGRGIGSLLLDRSEEITRLGGARELYGSLESAKARSFFERHDYRFRQGANGEEAFKAYYGR